MAQGRLSFGLALSFGNKGAQKSILADKFLIESFAFLTFSVRFQHTFHGMTWCN